MFEYSAICQYSSSCAKSCIYIYLSILVYIYRSVVPDLLYLTPIHYIHNVFCLTKYMQEQSETISETKLSKHFLVAVSFKLQLKEFCTEQVFI